MKYNITLTNHFKSLEHLIYLTLIFPFGIYYVVTKDGYTNGIPVIFGTGYLICLIPTLFLHIEYYIKNKNKSLAIDSENKTITINEKKTVHFNEIRTIMYVMPYVWHRKGFVKTLSFEDYHYAIIKFKNNEQFIFTCLMAFPVENALSVLPAVTVIKRKALFASTLINQV